MDTEYLKKVGIFVLSVVLSIGILFYFGYHIWRSFTKEIETVSATQIVHSDTIKAKGYIFRSETVIDSGSGNSLVPVVSEGEHIRKSGEVAKLYSEYAPDTVARIAEIEKQIAVLSRYSKTDGMSLKDTANIDREIFSILSDMRGYSDFGKAGSAAALRQNLLAGVGERAVLTGGLTNLSDQIAKLESEKASLTSGLGSLLGTVYTPVSGFYYSETDGYENVFKAELLSDISLKELKELLLSSPEAEGGAGKTVTNSRWYLVCPIDEEERNTYKAGKSCNVKFSNTELQLSMDVEQVLYDKESAAVVLSTNVMPEGFDFYRMQDVELEKAQYQGLKVPASAVRLIDGVTGVYILNVSTVSFRQVEILYTADSNYIVKIPDGSEIPSKDDKEALKNYVPHLRLHDSIIVEGKGLYEGRVIGD